MRARPLLNGLVVPIKQVLAIPVCVARLADAGAQVIHVEQSEGDFARGYDDIAAGGQRRPQPPVNRERHSD